MKQIVKTAAASRLVAAFLGALCVTVGGVLASDYPAFYAQICGG